MNDYWEMMREARGRRYRLPTVGEAQGGDGGGYDQPPGGPPGMEDGGMSGQWWMRGMIAQFLKMYSGKWGRSLVFLKSLRQHRPLFGHLILLFAVMSVSTAVAAEKDVKHSIDIQLEHCIDSNTTTAGVNTLNPTTVWMNTCTADAMNKWDKEMNEIYKKLMPSSTIKQRASLKKSQVVWLK